MIFFFIKCIEIAEPPHKNALVNESRFQMILIMKTKVSKISLNCLFNKVRIYLEKMDQIRFGSSL